MEELPRRLGLWLANLVLNRDLDRTLKRHRAAAEKLDRVLREMLEQ